MKTSRSKHLTLILSIFSICSAAAQTMYVPSGTAGIGSTAAGNLNVGIGTTNAPSFKLHVKTSYPNDGIKIEQNGTGAAFLGLFNTLPTGHNWSILSTGNGSSQGGGKLMFYDYSTPPALANQASRMCIGNTGNIGIGFFHNFAPTTRLHVNNGSIKLTGLDTVHGAPNIFWGGNPFSYMGPVTAPNGEWALEYNSGMKGLNFWRPYLSHDGAGGTQMLVNNVLFLSDNNRVGIGTATPSALLTVNGKTLIGDPSLVNINTTYDYNLYVQKGILTERLKVALRTDNVNWSDYVFESDYKRNSLYDVEEFVKCNKHLPNMPSADEIYAEGLDVAQMDAALLRQIEELWLHVIDLKKENEELKKIIKQ